MPFCCTTSLDDIEDNTLFDDIKKDKKLHFSESNLDNATWENTEPFKPNVTHGKVIKVYDGDTCRFMIEINNGTHAFKARLLHINTAEMKTHCVHEKHMAYVARDRARQLLKQKIVYVRCTGTDKYGRKLVTICLNDRREMYHEVILRERLAYAYEGVRKFADEVLSPTEQEQICPTCMKD